MDYEKQRNGEAFTILGFIQRNDIALGPVSGDNPSTTWVVSVVMGA